VARAAGVSQSTVSYVLRNTPGVSIKPETRRRVLAAAERLGYAPHFSASSLASGKTDIIGLLLPSQEFQFQSYYSDMVQGIIQEANHTPYYFLYLGQDQVEKYRRCFSRKYLDGIIILQSKDDDSHVRALQDYDIPVVTVDYVNSAGFPSVSMDYEKAVDAAYAYMSSRRRTKIAFVCSDRDLQPNRRHIRRHHELREIYGNGIAFVNVDYEKVLAAGGRIGEYLDQETWDGFVVDGVARGLHVADHMQQNGRALGEDFDLSVFCTGERYMNVPSDVQLLEAHGEEMGKHAWRIMDRMLRGEKPREASILLPFLESTRQRRAF
jgi:DNA-binding LacI/PurR family transcriptional regulator